MWPKSHGQHTETLTATVWFYVYVSLTAAAQLLTRRLRGAAGCLCSTSSADCQKKKESWQAGVDLAAVTQCGKLTLTQTPPAQRILQRLFLAGFYPQSCDCNVKPLTGKHRRTTLSAANECSVYKEQLKLLRAQRTDESPVTNKQRRHGKLRQFKERAGTVIFSDIPASSFACIVKLVRYSCVLRLIL